MIKNSKVLDLNNLSVENIEQYGLIINQIREDFNLLVASILTENNQPYWLLSSIVSREPDYSPLFFRCCNLELVKFNIDNNLDLEKIVLYDKVLYKVIKKYSYSKRLKLIVEYKSEIFMPFKNIYFQIRNIFRSLIIIMLVLLAKLFTKKNQFSAKTSFILMSTHIFKNSIYNLNKFDYEDRYYPNLFHYLNNSIQNKILFVPGFPGGPQNYVNLFRKLKLSEINFLIKDNLLHLSDYLYAFSSSFKTLFLNIPKTFFREVEIQSLIKSELRSFVFDYKTIEALLNYRFVYRLSKEKLNVEMFVDWHENHLSSKGFMLGFNKFLPNIVTIGYQGIIDSSAQKINLHPTVFERLSMLSPKTYSVIGKGLVKNFKEFDNDINVTVGPSFRYNYLWSEKKLNRKLEVFNILVALPISLTEANLILELLDETFKFLPSSLSLKAQVKCHPTYNPSKIKKLTYIQDERVEFVEGSFVDIIYDTSLLISGASTTCIEAMTIGVPVVVSGSKAGVINTSIPNSIPTIFYRTITDSNELAEFIQTLIIRNENHNNELLREDYFKRADKDSVALFFSTND
jgi:hypothetical protein